MKGSPVLVQKLMREMNFIKSRKLNQSIKCFIPFRNASRDSEMRMEKGKKENESASG